MAIPLIAMVGLLAYVAGTSVNNAINLDRAPNLIHATSLPTAEFTRLVQDERAAAVVYLFQPTAANLAAYDAAVKATNADKPAFLAAMNSPGTTSSETADEAKAIDPLITGLGQLPTLRAGVTGQALTPLAALGGYSAGIQDELKLFLAEADSLTNATAADQALGLIATVSAREALSQEYALLSGVLAGQRMTQTDRAAFAEMVATRQGDMVDAGSLLDPANLAIFNRQVNNTEQTQLAQIEEVVSAGTPLSKLPITLDQWQGLAGQLLGQYYAGGVNVANAQLVSDRQISNDAKTRVVITGGIGLVGLLLTIMVTILVARGIIRRLGGLERTALQLAEVQLPDVVARLRRGEDVDVDTEAPPLQVGRDEIGRVGQAFDLVRQTAVRAAVEEARLRRGLNDVFRSLARRSQSLLHRQLTLLDQMERRASDPAALDDLFRLDHLTTRMRRHAEGLVILAGAPPSRGWSSPVRMVDVMRGAIAEVEDYARVAVATRSQAALAGSAVADVIHLLAELIENATTLSPPYTSVRVSGDTVASGFAIEVEDRGLGIRPQRLAELNDRLASPPEFNPSDSEQLGLFVVSQLAKRHGIRVTLKTSAYGGTAAVVLIPRQLVVTEDAGRAGLPGGPAAVAVAELETNGYHAVAAAPDDPGRPSGPAFPELRGLPGTPQAPGIRISGALRHSQGTSTEDLGHGAHAAAPPSPVNGGPGPQAGPGDLPRRQDSDGRQNGAGQVPFAGVGSAPDGTPPSAFDVFTPRRRGQDTGEAPVPDDAGPGQDLAAAAASPADAVPFAPIMPAPTAGDAPYPGPGSPPYPDEPAPFPGWTSLSPGGGGTPDTPGRPTMPSDPATPVTPAASGPPDPGLAPPWALPRPGSPPGAPAGADPDSPADEPAAEDDIKGLPRRIRQASLAPQLRANPPQRRVTVASSGPSSGPSPADIRRTMSALQRGWEQGRTQPTPGPGASEPPWPPSAGTPGSSEAGRHADASSSPGLGEGDDSTAGEEQRGQSDGT